MVFATAVKAPQASSAQANTAFRARTVDARRMRAPWLGFERLCLEPGGGPAKEYHGKGTDPRLAISGWSHAPPRLPERESLRVPHVPGTAVSGCRPAPLR